MPRPRRVVLLGGTFDPLHSGHLAVADQVAAALGAEAIWLIPTNLPPHRPAPEAGVDDRLAMVGAAAQARPDLVVIDAEARRPGVSYTVDTLEALAQQHGAVEMWFLLGADAAREIGSWRASAQLLAANCFAIVNREGVDEMTEAEAARLGFDPVRTRLLRVDSPPISATDIRRRVRAGRSIAGLVPDSVASVIAARGLYRAAPVK